MTTLLVIASAIGFFALLMTSIALHEVGHLVPGKLFGVKTTQYFVGFGKTLWSRHLGETEVGVKALPLGGYVRLVGMYPPSKGDDGVEHVGPVARLADSARNAEYETIGPEDHGRLFYEKKTWQKLIIMFGGPLVNLVLAFAIFQGINTFHGQWQNGLTIATVNQCAIPASANRTTCTAADPKTPAAQMGIKPGDTIVSFNGMRLTSGPQLTGLIRANNGNPATVEVFRDGKFITLPTVNTMVTGVADQLRPGRTVQAGFLGIQAAPVLVHDGPLGTASQMWTMTEQSVIALAQFPVTVYDTAKNLVTGAPRDPNGPMSIVGASTVAGEVATAPGLTLGDRIATWFGLLGSVNLFVFLLNMVPLLPLDGGHIAAALYEGARRQLAKLLGRRDPGHVDTARLLPVAYAVGGFLALSGVVLVLADIISPLKPF